MISSTIHSVVIGYLCSSKFIEVRSVKLDSWRIDVNTFEDLKWAEFKITIEKIVGDSLEESMLRRYICEHCREKIEHIGRTPFYLEEKKVEVI